MSGTHPDNFRQEDSRYKDAAKTVCDNIRHRVFETKRLLALDKAIKDLSYCAYIPDLKATSGYVTASVQDICKFIAWFCQTNKLVFNNRYTSVEEMEQCKNTIIGSVL